MTHACTITHPTVCFGISRHQVIIPLKVIDVVDYQDGCFQYTFALNHPKPSDYLQCHQKADFNSVIISEDRPLCDEYSKIALTLEDAKQQVTKQLIADRAAAMRTVNSIDNALAKIDDDVSELAQSLNKP